MESIWLKIILPIVVSFLFPVWFLLILVIPSLMILSPVLGSIFSIGSVDIQIFDIVILIAITKIVSVVRRGSVCNHQIHKAIAIFLGILLITTIIAGIRFGTEIFSSEIVSLLRLITQIVVIPLMTLSVMEKEVNHIQRFLDYGGYIIVGTIVLNIWLLQIERPLGEVQVHEGIVRYFGPLGDQVSFVLLYFIFKALMYRKLWEAFYFIVGMVLTGTRGALGALLVGLGIMLWQGFFVKQRIQRVLVLLGICIVLGILLWSDAGSMRSRLLDEELFRKGINQRLFTTSLAFKVFSDNLLLGVGFTGFKYIALDYGAIEEAVERLGSFAPNYIATAGNQFLQVATDGGVIGLGVFIWMILVISRSLRWAMENAPINQRPIFAAGYLWLWSLVIGNQTAAWILPGSLISYLLWLLLGLTISVELRARLAGQERHRVGTLRPQVLTGMK